MNVAYALILSLFLLLSGGSNQHFVGDGFRPSNMVGHHFETAPSLKTYQHGKLKYRSSGSAELQHEDFLFSNSDDDSESTPAATARYVLLYAFSYFIFAACGSKNKPSPLGEFLLYLSSCKYLMFRVFRI